MVKKSNLKKKTGVRARRETPRRRKSTSNIESVKKADAIIDIKGETAGEKGTEFHLRMPANIAKEQSTGRVTREGEADFHLYLGGKGGDKHGAKSQGFEHASDKC